MRKESHGKIVIECDSVVTLNSTLLDHNKFRLHTF